MDSLTQEETKEIDYHKSLSSTTRYKLLKLIKAGQGKYNLLQIKKIMNCSYQGLLDNISKLEKVELIVVTQKVNQIGKPIYPVWKEK